MQSAPRRRRRPPQIPRDPARHAILSGTEAIPTPLLVELLRNGAKLRPLCPLEEEPEPGYRPSAKMARIVRARDLTCRFPGARRLRRSAISIM